MKGMLSMMKTFNPYMYKPERDVSTCSNESDVLEFDKIEFEECSEDNLRVGNHDWCKCGNCWVGKREIDCLCCFDVHALNSKFDTEYISCYYSIKGVWNVTYEWNCAKECTNWTTCD